MLALRIWRAITMPTSKLFHQIDLPVDSVTSE